MTTIYRNKEFPNRSNNTRLIYSESNPLISLDNRYAFYAWGYALDKDSVPPKVKPLSTADSHR
jgi:hypothetical protein